jgi:arylsulfatase
MAVGWTWAFDTPFKWTKQIASHFGGTKQGMCMAWPNRIKDAGGIRWQFHHVIDIVPTILEATGIPAPVSVNGIDQSPMDGVSMVYTWDKANANAPSTRTMQYFEMMGNRALYHDGWIASTTPIVAPWDLAGVFPKDVANGYKWELYDLTKDWTQDNDLAKTNPDKLRQMQELFLVEAAKNQVFPLDNALATRALIPRPSLTAGRNVFTYARPVTGIPQDDAPSILVRNFTITAEVELPASRAASAPGGEGMLNTSGGRFAGYGLYLLKGKPVFTYNLCDFARFRWEGKEVLTPGKHTVAFEFTYDGPGFGKGGTGVLKVDGKAVDTKKIPNTIALINEWDETFDVGSDTGTPVDDKDYQVPFRFTGKLNKLTVQVGPMQLATPEKKAIQEKVGQRD